MKLKWLYFYLESTSLSFFRSTFFYEAYELLNSSKPGFQL